MARSNFKSNSFGSTTFELTARVQTIRIENLSSLGPVCELEHQPVARSEINSGILIYCVLLGEVCVVQIACLFTRECIFYWAKKVFRKTFLIFMFANEELIRFGRAP